MTVFLYIVGLTMGVALFFYLLNLASTGRDKLKKAPSVKTPSPQRGNEPSRPPLETIPPGERICPLCRSKLSKYEPLYAVPVKGDRDQKLMIYGCPYCYKDEEKSGDVKKTAP